MGINPEAIAHETHEMARNENNQEDEDMPDHRPARV
jgi:hypothetical protein